MHQEQTVTTNTATPMTAVQFFLKAYSVKQLSEIYGVSTKTFRRWIAPFKSHIGDKQGYFYNIAQVKRIVQTLGVPGAVEVG